MIYIALVLWVLSGRIVGGEWELYGCNHVYGCICTHASEYEANDIHYRLQDDYPPRVFVIDF